MSSRPKQPRLSLAGRGGVAAVACLLVACGGIETVQLGPESVALHSVGESARLTAIARDSRGALVKEAEMAYLSSVPSVASVDNSGKVTALKSGTTTVTATARNMFNKTFTGRTLVKVQIPKAIEVSPLSLQLLGVDQGGSMVASLLDEEGQLISDQVFTWQSENPNVATAENGRVTPTGIGETRVVVSAAGRHAEVKVEVRQPAFARFQVEPSSLKLKMFQFAKLSRKAWDAAGRDVPGLALTYRSSDPQVARVTPAGIVTGLSPGKAKIVVAAGEKEQSVKVTVQRK